MMKKIIGFICVVSLFCLVGALPAMAAGAEYFGGGGIFTIGVTSSTSVNTSNNVFLEYIPTNNGQNYAAGSKNTAGDREYATAGGPNAATNIYYVANQAIGSSTMAVDPSGLASGTTTGWTAQ